MIILTIINFILTFFNQNFISLFRQTVPSLDNLTLWLTNFSIPQTLVDVYSLCWLFLPIGTITVLFWLTFYIILIKIIFAFIHFLSAGLLLGE